VQGVGSVGVTPQLKAAFAARMEKSTASRRRARSGLDTYASMAAAAEGACAPPSCSAGTSSPATPTDVGRCRAPRLRVTVSITTK